MYVYTIYRTFYPKAPSIIFVYLVSLITTLIFRLLQYLTKVRVISKIYNRSWLHLVPILDERSLKQNIKFIYILTIIPRLILLLLFIINIFYFQKISMIYYFVFLGVLPLIYLLVIKYIEYIMEECIKILEELYEFIILFEICDASRDFEHHSKAIYDNTSVSIRKYIDISLESYNNNNEAIIEYEGSPLAKHLHCLTLEKKLNKNLKDMTTEEIFILDDEFNFIMPKILVLKVFLDVNTKNANKYAYISEIKVIILIMYLICWLYFLVISYPTLINFEYTLTILALLTQHSVIYDPFSNTSLSYLFDYL